MGIFLVFSFSQYCASGGLGDVCFDTDDKEDAITAAKAETNDYVYVWDRTTNETIYSKE